MKVWLGTFARASIEARLGTDTVAGMQAALRHYTRRLRSGRTPIEVPRFRQEDARDPSGTEIDLPIERTIWQTLEDEARRQAVSIERLVVHALYVYMADLDSAFPMMRLA